MTSAWLVFIGAFILMLGAVGQAVNEMLKYARYFKSVPEATRIELVRVLPFGTQIRGLKAPWKRVAATIILVLISFSNLIGVSFILLDLFIRVPKRVFEIRTSQGQEVADVAEAGRKAQMWFIVFAGSLLVTIGAAMPL